MWCGAIAASVKVRSPSQTAAGYREKGRFEIPDKGQKNWAHPVISDGRLYVRNQDTLLVYHIKAQAASPAPSSAKASQDIIGRQD